MDNEPKTEITEDQVSIDVENLDESNNNFEGDSEPTVVVKKTTGGLSLLISLVALAGVVYLYYKDWQAIGQGDVNAVSASELQQLKDSDQVVATKLQNSQVDIESLQQKIADISALKQQVNQLSQQLAAIEENNGTAANVMPFDNSANESTMNRLAQQLTEQTRALQQLQSQPATSNSGLVSADTLATNYDQIEKNAAIQVLLNTEILLATQRLDVAISSLDSYIKISGLNALDKNKVLGILQQLQQIEVIDTEMIKQQLEAVSAQVQALQLTTQTTTEAESKWYERFVSVKKIAEDNNITSTAQLVTLKTTLNRWLYQAKLYLILNDQSGWDNSLSQANQLIKNDLPENNGLLTALNNLANQSVEVELPRQLNIGAVIEQLKGSR